jgi:hypothetical protein
MVLMPMLPWLAILLPWQVFFPVKVNIHLGGGNAAAQHARNFQPRSNSESRHGFFQRTRRNSGIQECAQKHIAADAGKTLEISDAHRKWTDFSS